MATAYLVWEDTTLAFEAPTFSQARDAAWRWHLRKLRRLAACSFMTFEEEVDDAGTR